MASSYAGAIVQHPRDDSPCTDQAYAPANDDTRKLTLSAELLQMYGLSDAHQAEAVEALVRSACTYGNESLVAGLRTMLDGMAKAIEIHAETKNEIYLLHEGILRMKQEVSDTQEQLATTEAMAEQNLQVWRPNAPPPPTPRSH